MPGFESKQNRVNRFKGFETKLEEMRFPFISQFVTPWVTRCRITRLNERNVFTAFSFFIYFKFTFYGK
jgi:hypothetical protein